MPADTTVTTSFERLHEGDAFAMGSRTVTDDDVASFGALVGDLHDRDLVPGALTLSLTLALAREGPAGAIALRGLTDVLFTRPVMAGDTLSVNGRIASLAPLDGQTGLVTVVLLTANQHDRTVLRARVQMLWPREDAGDHPTEESCRG